ncbi:hypothetical protein [Microvirga ossetica]|uniref:hypothetical protein n=1 Tax=Microvirga ossetica TaxID=1882682 RepID=UPI0012FFD76C|nr:hypothetical protein [Microvirga ossetica]
MAVVFFEKSSEPTLPVDVYRHLRSFCPYGRTPLSTQTGALSFWTYYRFSGFFRIVHKLEHMNSESGVQPIEAWPFFALLQSWIAEITERINRIGAHPQ